MSVPVVEWLICNYECCKGDCPVQPPLAGGFMLPEGKAGQHYMGTFIFKGDEPMNIGVLGLPDWARAKQYGVSLVISGVTLSRLRRPTLRVRSASSRER